MEQEKQEQIIEEVTQAEVVPAPKFAKSKLVTVRLIKPHTHEGKKLTPGTELAVPADQARWLVLMQAAVK